MNTKSMSYYSQPRTDLLALLPKHRHFNKSLDLGCGAGVTSEYLKQHTSVTCTVGIEQNAKVAEQARTRLDAVYTLKVESESLPFAPLDFDLLICADILEHLSDPWRVLKNYVRFLKPGGLVLLSLPNVQNWKIIWNLMHGQWIYSSSGLLDRDHLRFFTMTTARQLVHDAGLSIIKTKTTMGTEMKIINALTLGLCRHMLAFHLYILAQKDPNAPQ